MTTTLVISPHLDDAVLSVGGAMAAWLTSGERVVVASVYTKGPPLAEIAPRMRKFADYATRRAEDAAALARLGAESRYLDQIERAFRRPYLTGWGFFRTPPEREGFTTLGAVKHALDGLLDVAPDRILVPLGIGNHVDHVEAMLAAIDWAIAHDLFDRVRFYEDFYGLAGTMRAHHPIACTRTWHGMRSPLLRARRLGVIMRTIAAGRAGPSIAHYFPPSLCDARWTVGTATIRARDQLAAIACYQSQIRAFGGLAGIARALRTYHAYWGGGEPLWRVSPL